MLINPFTGQVLNANPEGHNQYWNPNGPSADFSLPLKPSISPGKIAKGLARLRVSQFAKALSRPTSKREDELLRDLRTKGGVKKARDFYVEDLEIISDMGPEHIGWTRKEYNDYIDRVKKIVRSGNRAMSARAVVSAIKKRKFGSGQFVKRKSYRDPKYLFDRTFAKSGKLTPREFPEPN
jgi:hypothetical protein